MALLDQHKLGLTIKILIAATCLNYHIFVLLKNDIPAVVEK